MREVGANPQRIEGNPVPPAERARKMGLKSKRPDRFRSAFIGRQKQTPGPFPIRLHRPTKANARTVSDPGVLRDDLTRQPP